MTALKRELLTPQIEKLTNNQSFHNIDDFDELSYLDFSTSTRYLLLYTYPFLLLTSLSILYKRQVLKSHSTLLTHSFYMQLNSSGKRLNNGLAFGRLILEVANLASLGAGAIFSAIQLAHGIRRRIGAGV